MRGSPFWQTAFLFAGAIFLAWQAWRGWRAGLFRSGVNLAAVLVSAALGCLAAELVAAPFGGLRSLPGLVAGVGVGGGLGIVLFGAIWFFGAVAFKRTEHHAFGPLRVLWGTGGALFGFLMGLAILLGSISIVRSLGTLADSRIEAGAPEPPRSVQASVAGLVILKESLELGSTGRLLESVDILPPDFYELVHQIGRVTGDQERMRRFLDYPGIQKILRNPRVIELLNDPGLIRAAQEKDIFVVFNNKAVAAAAKDPALAEQLREVDLRAALKFALESPQTSPQPAVSPSPKKHK
jgi:hypothetical protein